MKKLIYQNYDKKYYHSELNIEWMHRESNGNDLFMESFKDWQKYARKTNNDILIVTHLAHLIRVPRTLRIKESDLWNNALLCSWFAINQTIHIVSKWNVGHIVD